VAIRGDIMATVTPGTLYVVVKIDMMSGTYGYDLHSEAFINWETANEYRCSLEDEMYMGVIKKVTLNYS
jgi:hypothetical protein